MVHLAYRELSRIIQKDLKHYSEYEYQYFDTLVSIIEKAHKG
jgi:hypothetical protein